MIQSLVSRLGVLAIVWWLAPGRAAAAEPVDFSRDIQPLLAKRCFACHGPDTQEAGLRFDDAAAATARYMEHTPAGTANREGIAP